MSIEISERGAPAVRIRAGLIAPNIEALAFKEAEGRYNVVGNIEEMTLPHVYHRRNYALLNGVELGTMVERPAGTPDGMIEEAQQLGRVKVTCYIRELNRFAGKYLDLMNEVQGLDAMTQEQVDPHNEFVDHAEKVRDRIRWVNDRLYWIIDVYLGGREGREGAVSSAACRGVSIPIVGQPSVTLDGWPLPVIAGLTVAGLGAFYLWLKSDFGSWMEVWDKVLSFCKEPAVSKEKCEEALGKASKSKPTGPGDAVGKILDILKPAGIAAGVVLVAGGGWKVYEQSQRRRETSP